jgi:hypothetical protein
VVVYVNRRWDLDRYRMAVGFHNQTPVGYCFLWFVLFRGTPSRQPDRMKDVTERKISPSRYVGALPVAIHELSRSGDAERAKAR